MATTAPYEYSMIQVPPTIEVGKRDQGTAAAKYLQAEVDKMAGRGWEFYRVDSIGVRVAAGCLMGMLGQKNPIEEYYVVTFRRPAGA